MLFGKPITPIKKRAFEFKELNLYTNELLLPLNLRLSKIYKIILYLFWEYF